MSILSLPNDDPRKIIFVAVSLCLVCSLIVSVAAVSLRPLQEANAALDKRKNILQAAGLLEPGIDINQVFDERIETRIVDLDRGQFTTEIDAATYNQRAAAQDPTLSDEIPGGDDIAGIGRRAKYAPVYLVRTDGAVEQVVIPMHGKGLWSTMYGFVSLQTDINTVAGVTYYDHGETPGLGGEIANPSWQARWVDKEIYNAAGDASLRVIKGPVNPASSNAIHEIDGISGSTLTGNGVTNSIQYWFGANGFQPFLRMLQETGVE